jgi:AcrR family transcriptional regulator
MTTTRIRRQKRRDTPQSTAVLILEEAANLIARHGVDGLRLDKISERLGISRAALYQHYPDGREQILERIAMQAVETPIPLFQDEHTDPLDTLIAGIRELVQGLIRNPAYPRIMLRDFSSPGGLPELTRQLGRPGVAEKRGVLRPMHERLGALLEALHSAGRIRPLSGFALLNAVLGTTLMSIVHPPFKSRSGNLTKIALDIEAAIIDLALAYMRPIPADEGRKVLPAPA